MVEKTESMHRAVLGIDLGGTKLSGALFTIDGEPIHRTEIQHGAKGGAETGSLVVQKVLELKSHAQDHPHSVESIGICVPGISNQEQRTVWAPNIPDWEAYPLYKELRDAINDPAIPISIESDRNCYILGEMWKGNARNCSNAIFMAIGTGIGIGIVSNGQIINGMNGISGAIGWMALDRPYSKEYDPCGQFEFHASGTGIARKAVYLIEQGAKSEYLNADQVSVRNVFSAYAANDPVAVEVLEKCIEYWGMAVANLVSLLNPEKIIFGGGGFGPAIQFLDEIYEEACKWAQPISIQQVKLETSALQGDAGLYGAGYMAIRNEFMQ